MGSRTPEACPGPESRPPSPPGMHGLRRGYPAHGSMEGGPVGRAVARGETSLQGGVERNQCWGETPISRGGSVGGRDQGWGAAADRRRRLGPGLEDG
ncbi:hypothetical protein NDU88_000281 [Pleurodeles waltl]|uniref:Uncharacterized protein n=1 Tax=Pleurodeles waltl TaxID=8319 RepID=A0AAV7KQ94_PLEWA|nr:hypothetical protein NDU88_000281 [Pleurodeles waltl]